jgi:alkylation response protein AidB-like acyl-CoA dehydrogenase
LIMNFDLSEEQLMLQDSVARLLADRCSFEQRHAYLAEAGGYSESLWSQYAELGLLGLPFAEADGGFGGGPVDTLIVMQSLGRVLALEPFLATVILAGGVLRDAASTARGAHSVDRGGQADHGAGAQRNPGSLRFGPGRDHGAPRRRGLGRQRREALRARR